MVPWLAAMTSPSCRMECCAKMFMMVQDATERRRSRDSCCYVMYIFDHILSLREKTREEKGRRHPVKKIGKPYEEEEEGKRNNERQGEREYV